MTGRPPTVDALLRTSAGVLSAAGVPSPLVDAESLLAHAWGREVAEVRRGRLLGETVPTEVVTSLRALVGRRAERLPLQHLTGVAHFAGVDLHVGPGVFVPRPETEVLVELAVAALAGLVEPVVVDLCTGSGAIALAVARRRPDAWVGAVELSPEAYRYAAINVAAHAAAPAGVDLRQGRAQDAFEDRLAGVDLVTSNPPYIPPDAEPVDVEVREHDPALALYGGGEDGLQVPLEVATRAAELLRPGGVLLMEHADAQGESLPAALTAEGSWATVEDHRDLTGRPRVTRAVRG